LHQAAPRPGGQLPRRDSRRRGAPLQRRAGLRDHGGDQAGCRVLPAAQDDALGREEGKGGERMRKTLAFVACVVFAGPGSAADNELTAKEKADGWLLLFDGKSLDGWMTSGGKPSKTPVEDGCINPHRCGGYMMVHKKQWDNFVLSLDYKISKGCNSGVFIRTY